MNEYRIEDLAREAGTTVRNVRAYRDRGLLPPPRREGRIALYRESHLGRLRLIAALLERGYTLANIAELIDAWRQGHDVRELLGLEAALAEPWITDEPVMTKTKTELIATFGEEITDELVAQVTALGIIRADPNTPDLFQVTNARLFAVGAELASAGVPLSASLEHARQLRDQVDAIASNFVELTTTHIFDPLGDGPPRDEIPRLTELIRRLRPLAQQAVDAELARAMARYIQAHLSERFDRMLSEINADKSAAS